MPCRAAVLASSHGYCPAALAVPGPLRQQVFCDNFEDAIAVDRRLTLPSNRCSALPELLVHLFTVTTASSAAAAVDSTTSSSPTIG
jgi:hypothetical protein